MGRKTEYYLIVTQWDENCKGGSYQVWRKIIRLDNTTNKEAELKATEYEKELNNGNEWSAQNYYDKKSFFSVYSGPYSQAREYRNFDTWECNAQ